MRKMTFVLVSLSLVFVGVSACSSDESSPAPVGTGGSAGSSSGGKCNNTADKAALDATYDAGKVSDVAGDCAVGCLGKPDPCVQECIVKGTGLSQDCAGCLAASADCSKKNCLMDCVSDPGSVQCQICQCGLKPGQSVNCLLAYETCSGIANTVCSNIPEAGTEDAPAEAAEEAAAEAAAEAGEEAATEAGEEAAAEASTEAAAD